MRLVSLAPIARRLFIAVALMFATVQLAQADARAVNVSSKRLVNASTQFAEATHTLMKKRKAGAGADLIKSADWFSTLAKRLRTEVKQGVVNGTARDTLQEMRNEEQRIVGLLANTRNPSPRMTRTWERSQEMLELLASGKATTMESAPTNKLAKKSKAARHHVDRIEHISEETKNSFRRLMGRDASLSGKPWAKELDGSLSAFDQDANTLQKQFGQSGSLDAGTLKRMKDRAAGISTIVKDKAVGGATRATWGRLVQHLAALK